MRPHLDYLYEIQEPDKLVLSGYETGGEKVIFDLKHGESLFFFRNISDAIYEKAFEALYVSRFEDYKNVFNTIDCRFARKFYKFVQTGPTSIMTSEKSIKFYLDPLNVLDLRSPSNAFYMTEKILSLPELYEQLTQKNLYKGFFVDNSDKKTGFSKAIEDDIKNILDFFTKQQQ